MCVYETVFYTAHACLHDALYVLPVHMCVCGAVFMDSCLYICTCVVILEIYNFVFGANYGLYVYVCMYVHVCLAYSGL